MKRILILTKKKTVPPKSVCSLVRIALKKNSLEATVGYWGDISMYFDNEKNIFDIYYRNTPLKNYQLIFFRTVGDFSDAATAVANYCELNKIQYFDKSFINTNSNSKLVQSCRFITAKLNFPKTLYLGSNPRSLKKILLKNMGVPLIAKTIAGSKGNNIFLLKTPRQIKKFLKNKLLPKIIFQEFIPNEFDWRIVIMGKDVVSTEKRIRNAKEFRNNVCLGAKEIFCPAPKKIVALAKKAAKIMDLTICGVDIIESSKKFYLLEANRSPAFTNNMKISPEIPGLVNFLKKCLK